MTTARQIRQVFRPLVERHDDLVALNGRWLWVKPIHHVGLRLYIDSTRLADFAAIQWSTIEVFLFERPIDRYLGRYGFHYMRGATETVRRTDQDWQWSDPTMIGDLIAMIEDEALPFLRSLRTLESYVAYFRATFDRHHIELPEDRLIVDIALGDLDAARTTCLALLPKYRENRHPNWEPYQNWRTTVLTVAEPLLAGDRRALAAILHAWEAGNIRGTALEPHWAPSPFPLEAV